MNINFSTEYNYALVEEEIQKKWEACSKFSVEEEKDKSKFIVFLCSPIQVEDFIWDM